MIDVKNHLPVYYKKSKYIKSITEPVNDEFLALSNKTDSAFLNLFPDSADESGIADFEKDFDITSDDDIEIRRSRIKSKFLRPQTSTKEKLLSVVRSFDECGTVCEDNANYKFLINLTNPNVAFATSQAVDEVIPAHISIDCEVNDRENINGNVFVKGNMSGVKEHIHISPPSRDVEVTSLLFAGGMVTITEYANIRSENYGKYNINRRNTSD